MYLITTINQHECGWEIILPKASKEDCLSKLEAMRSKCYGQMMPSIYETTRVKNAQIVTNKQAEKLFGGKKSLENALEEYYENL